MRVVGIDGDVGDDDFAAYLVKTIIKTESHARGQGALVMQIKVKAVFGHAILCVDGFG